MTSRAQRWWFAVVALCACSSTLAGIQPLTVPTAGRAGFTLFEAARTGIVFTNHLRHQSVAENQIRLIGSGVALGDVDGDGRCDFYLARLEGPNALYRNLGDWKFEEITSAAGVACANQYSTGCALADLDGDGDLDLLVNSIGGGTRCFFNDGQARFTERNSGLLQKHCATSLALADIDGNGSLDLYVANYRTNTIRSTGLQLLNVNGRRMFRPEDRDSYEFTPEGAVIEHAEPDAIYLNDGQGNFTPLSWTDGRFLDVNGRSLARADRDWGLAAMFRDMNGDGAPDLYVCNDFWSDDAVWLNAGAGKFRAMPQLALRITSTFSMGVDFADINRDGLDDFVVLDMRSREHARRAVQRSMLGSVPEVAAIEARPQTERNTLFLNRGDGTYAEIAQLAGVQASEWSWCPAFVDVDLDGFEDLLITTGHAFDSQDVDALEQVENAPRRPGEKYGERILRYPPLHVANQAFRNRGDLTFEPAGDRWHFNLTGVSHGLALGDLDSDGDLDAVVNNLNGAPALYRNESAAPRLLVRLKGKSPNTQGVGARIEVTGGVVTQRQEMVSGGRYLSSDAPERMFAAWHATNRFNVKVTWRGGAVTVVTNVPANSVCEVAEASAAESPRSKVQSSKPAPLFRDVSESLAHVHRDSPWDEFARQPLLPRRFSQNGPGITWADLDADGRDDLLISTGRGGELPAIRNEGSGAFARWARLSVPASQEDQTSVLAWRAGDASSLLVGQANDERAGSNAPALHLAIRAGALVTNSVLEASSANAGAIAAADIDGDGDLDLFIGAQANGGRYPEAGASRTLRNENGRFMAAQTFDLGIVNSGVFTDLDADGFPEIILAREWGPIRILKNNRGTFAPIDPRLGGAALPSQFQVLSSLTGWWQGVSAGDFDGDGRMDIVASNWGRNSPYEPFVRDSIRLHYGDLLGAGRGDMVEAYVENGRAVPWRDLETLARALPWLRGAFPTHRAFAAASVEQVLGPAAARARELRVAWLESTVFLNRGDHFEAKPLPIEAQFAPAFGIAVADFNGDGREDLVLGQNFFGTDGETSRYDAGRSLLLEGRGDGNFRAVPGQASGVLVYGEARGVAASDFDGDGRVDVCIGQNNAATKLFRNERARSGLRVRLQGPNENQTGVGAVVRATLADGTQSPAREVHAGSGWLSQSSAVLVFAGDVISLTVRWVGGASHTVGVPSGAREVTIDSDGKLRVLN